MAKITLVLGGVRSGKSRFAENLVITSGKNPVYLATAEFVDADLQCRIEEHQKRRDKTWQTVEVPIALSSSLERFNQQQTIALVDCLSVWLTNLMMRGQNINNLTDGLIETLRSLKCDCVLVSSEVGFGILPENRLGREFCDQLGLINQKIAAIADNVYLIVAGVPLTLKGETR